MIPHFYGGVLRGTVQILDKNPFLLGPRKLSRNVGTVYQNPENQLFMKHVDSEIAFGLENIGLEKEDMENQIHEIAENLGFNDLLRRETSTLSGGEKQKVALASILAMGPDILLLDEPTSELDPSVAKEFMITLKRLNQHHHKTIIIIEHRLERVVEYVNRIILMKNGKIIADSTPKSVLYSSSEEVQYSIPLVRLFQSLNEKLNLNSTPLNLNEAISALNPIVKDIYFLKTPETRRIDHSTDEPVAEISHLWFKYPSSSSWILHDISLQIFHGELLAIIGKNGSGKTTLLKQLNGLLRPQKGVITFRNQDMKLKSVAQISRDIGYIFQNPSIQFYQDTLFDEMNFVLRNYGYKKEVRGELIRKALEIFGISQYSSHYGRFLSIGEQQRAALATVLFLQPSILLLDEPTHGMDFEQKMNFMKYLIDYRKKGNAVVLITHDVETVARYAERVIILSEGKITAEGNPHQILSKEEPFIPQINRLAKNFPAIPDSILTVEELLEVILDETQ